MFLSDSHYCYIQMGFSRGSNNFTEVAALKLLICFSLEKNCTHLHIFRDSMIVIKWIKKVQSCPNVLLNSLLVEFLRHLEDFDSFSCRHVYRERNIEADQLSKKGVNIPRSQWKFISKHQNVTYYEYYHRPLIDGLAPLTTNCFLS